jgi:predicted tellurium resistance membrane protein TerC
VAQITVMLRRSPAGGRLEARTAAGVVMSALLSWDALGSFLSLTFLELVLSVDNILFVAVAAARLQPSQRNLGRQLGLWLALVLRVAMLTGIVWLTRIDVALFTLMHRPVTVKDLVLVAGGLFLLWKGTTEIHDSIETGEGEAEAPPGPPAGLAAVVLQIGLINIVFSLDSVITAVGMASELLVMIAAVMVATFAMMVAAKPVGDFIEARPTAKMLGLAFILLVGVALIADGLGFHVPRGYLYFAIAFSLFVELLNGARRRPKRKPGR